MSGRTVALCGVMTALAVVILSLGSLIPAATFCCPILASFCVLVLQRECGSRAALTAFAAAALLGLLLAPDKEIAFLFLALGYYPVLMPHLHSWAGRLLWFNASAAAVYALMIFLLQLQALVKEFRETGLWMLLVLALLGNLVFFLYDLALRRLALRYAQKRSRFRAN